MKRNRIFITILIISLVLNIVFISLTIYKRNNTIGLSHVWDLATNNATFLYQQYDERGLIEAYDAAIGEMGTIFNVISDIDYGDNLTEFQKGELSYFYMNLITIPDVMKQHITEIRNIVKRLGEEDYDAFIKMKELRDKIE